VDNVGSALARLSPPYARFEASAVAALIRGVLLGGDVNLMLYKFVWTDYSVFALR